MVNRVITLDRQYGSGGCTIAKLIGEKLSIPVYNEEILKLASNKSGLGIENFERVDEKRNTSFLFSLVSSYYADANIEIANAINDDSLFFHISETIKELSDSPCVIVGRCADDILSKLNPLRVFICADLDTRAKRIGEKLNLTEKNSHSLIKKIDKSRNSYYNFYTSRAWGEPLNYDLVLNTTSLTYERVAEIIANSL